MTWRRPPSVSLADALKAIRILQPQDDEALIAIGRMLNLRLADDRGAGSGDVHSAIEPSATVMSRTTISRAEPLGASGDLQDDVEPNDDEDWGDWDEWENENFDASENLEPEGR